MNPNETFLLGKGKDSSPEQTVARIQEILLRHGYAPVYEPQEPQLGTCYFSRVSVKHFGSNGKGTAPEYCMASGYAELMERMQNRVMSAPARHNSPYSNLLRRSFPVSDLTGSLHPCVEQLKQRLVQSALGPELSPEAARNRIQSLIASLAPQGQYILRPFYSVAEGKEVLLPVTFLQLFTGTNGMAAGNTLEEAIVQGLCEVFERYVTLRILFDGLTPPEIPREYLQSHCPGIVNIINTIEQDPTYQVFVLDASLGMGIPCAACVILNRQTLTLGVKFGAYPDLNIALERCFSEAVQGWKIQGFTKAGSLSYAPLGRTSWAEVLNILKISRGVYPVTLLEGVPGWEYTPWEKSCCGSNDGMMRRLLSILETMGRNVYIQDVSFLGFPTVYLYVPEMSEIAPVDILWLQERQIALNCQEIFTRLDIASDQDAEALLTAALLKRGSQLENTIDRLAGTAFRDPMPGGRKELEFLAGVCCWHLGRDKQALQFFRAVPQTPYTQAVIHYITGKLCGKTDAQMRSLLCRLAGQELADTVISQFSHRKQCLARVYPACCADCRNCLTRCDQGQIQEEYEKLLHIELQSDPGTGSLRQLFS